jgi:glycosyltransferase involved in cell wall biosynthesis
VARIAIVDMLFTWPPDGGARTDIKEIAVRLSRDHDVRLFCPAYEQFFPRGRIEGPLEGLAIERIPFNFYTFNYHFVATRFRRAVAGFRPDRVLIADAWFMKPHLALALAEHRPILRFYAYESLCLNRGSLWRRRRICTVDYPTVSRWGTFRCVLCAMWGQKFRSDTQHGQEFWGACCFLPAYRDRAVEMLRRAGGAIVYNSLIAEKVRRYNERVWIVPSGVDAGHFDVPPPQPAGRPLHVAMIGRATDPIKGFKVLRSAAAMLHQRRRDFKLLVTFKREEAYFKEPYIEVAGWFTQETLPRLYEQVEICVVPSVWAEPCGIVALEAMAAGRPVIVSRVGGLQHLVEDGVTGFIVPPGDPEALAERIETLLDDPQLRAAMGRAGRRRVLERYTWDAIYERHYRPIFGGGAS